MSHFTTIKTQIIAKEYLKKALDDMQMRYQEGNLEIRGYGGQKTRVEIKVPTSNPDHDLGFRKKKESYELVADWWGIKDINQKEFLQRLTQRYAYHVAKEQLEQQDFTIVEEEVQQDQTIHLTVRRMIE
ncbi:MAG: DUF1257 domain-containing protein [bacterium]|nr:DUF1257 domain-containing protein [bacterium]